MTPLCLSQFQLGTSPPRNPRGLAQKHCPGDRDLAFEREFDKGGGILWKFKVKRFDYFLKHFISDKYRVPQEFLKNGEHCIVDSQFKLR